MQKVFFSASVFLLAQALMARPLPADTAERAVAAVLQTQVEAWNRGDIQAFVSAYAEDCTFVGKQVLKGRAQLQARYEKTYSTQQTMGKLTFGNIQISALDWQVAVVVGEWHLDRTQAGGGPVGGVFSLVLKKRAGHWRIVLDHTA